MKGLTLSWALRPRPRQPTNSVIRPTHSMPKLINSHNPIQVGTFEKKTQKVGRCLMPRRHLAPCPWRWLGKGTKINSDSNAEQNGHAHCIWPFFELLER